MTDAKVIKKKGIISGYISVNVLRGMKTKQGPIFL
jgi:hypothetical protein